MRRALYDDADGFFVRPGPGPAGHFRTSVHASPLFARAVCQLLIRVDTALEHPERIDLVDIGAGRGELLRAVIAGLEAGPAVSLDVPPKLRERLRAVAVELAPRPADLPEDIEWTDRAPQATVGLLTATEWLDNVPLDVAAEDPPRYLHVTGRAGTRVSRRDERWMQAWWPPSGVSGTRVEIGLPRDEAWAEAVSTVKRGLAVAVDYGHLRDNRPVFGTLAGHLNGRRVAPVPDGSCDVSAYVAMDSVADAGSAVAGCEPVLLTQRAALRALGVHGRRPPLSQAREDPAGYVHALALAGAAAELTDPDGLGGHWWVVQPVGLTVIPEVLSVA